MAGLVIIAILVVVVAVGISRGVAQGREKTKGHNRCSYCRTRLKLAADRKSYAATCRKCGKTQPWATTA